MANKFPFQFRSRKAVSTRSAAKRKVETKRAAAPKETERGTTITTPKGVYNIPTVIRGKRSIKIKPEQAGALFARTGKNIGGPYKSISEGVKASKKRSKDIGKVIQQLNIRQRRQLQGIR